MNQAQPVKHTAKTDPTPKALDQALSKAPWHRPTVTFVPLQATAAGSGSVTDGFGASTPT